MSDIPANYIITEADDYILPPETGRGLEPGHSYLLTIKTDDPAEAGIQVYFNNGVDGSYPPADQVQMMASTGITEGRFIAPSSRLKLTVNSGFSSPLKVTLIEIKP